MQNTPCLQTIGDIESIECMSKKFLSSIKKADLSKRSEGLKTSEEFNENKEIINVVEIAIVEDEQINGLNIAYTKEDLLLLSKLVYAEAGSVWLSDYHQKAVANVVINRVLSDKFPNSIREVIYQKGQYSPVKSGAINNIPDERTIENVRMVLDGERVLPESVIWQSSHKQGVGVYKSIYDKTLGTTTYFCY